MRLESPAESRGLLAPFATVLGVLVFLFVALTTDTVLGTLLTGGQVFGVGAGDVCVDHNMVSGMDIDDSRSTALESGVTAHNAGVELCMHEPNAGRRLLGVASVVPVFALHSGALLLLWRLVRGARRRGAFNMVSVRRVRFLGWWMALGGLVATAGEGLAHRALLRAMLVTDEAPAWFDVGWIVRGVPWTLLITGFGLVTVARILEIGVRMRDDLEGTV